MSDLEEWEEQELQECLDEQENAWRIFEKGECYNLDRKKTNKRN